MQSMRIFIVEDNWDTLTSLKRYLEHLGHSVTTAQSMKAALAVIPSTEVDILISDIGLPDGTGWELLQHAKFRHPVFAIAITAYGTQADLERSKAAGFRRHVMKPFGGEELVPIIKEAIRELRPSSS